MAPSSPHGYSRYSENFQGANDNDASKAHVLVNSISLNDDWKVSLQQLHLWAYCCSRNISPIMV